MSTINMYRAARLPLNVSGYVSGVPSMVSRVNGDLGARERLVSRVLGGQPIAKVVNALVAAKFIVAEDAEGAVRAMYELGERCKLDATLLTRVSSVLAGLDGADETSEERCNRAISVGSTKFQWEWKHRRSGKVVTRDANGARVVKVG